MEDTGVPSGTPDGEDPDEQPARLVRPYIGSGSSDSPPEASDAGVSAWFPAAPFRGDDTAPGARAVAARPRRRGAAGRHRSRALGPVAVIVVAAIAVLAG